MKLFSVFVFVLFVALGNAQVTELPGSQVPITSNGTTKVATTVTPTTAATSNTTNATAATTATATTSKATTKQMSTTVAPTTLPPGGNYVVTDDKGNNCLLAQFDVKFSGKYELHNKSKVEFEFTLPENAEVDVNTSHCGSAENNALMVLMFDAGDMFMLEFTMDSTAKTFQLKSANASLNHTEVHFPNSNQTGVVEYGGVPDGTFFKADLGKSFKCYSEEEIPYTADDFQFSFTNLRLQPFNVNKTFAEESPCPADESPSHWFLTDSKGALCLLASFKVMFTGSYEKTDKKMATFSYALPQTAKVDEQKSMCGSAEDTNANTANAVLVLLANGDTFTQVFEADNKTNMFMLINATAKLTHNKANFPNSTHEGKVVTYGGAVPTPAFKTGLGSYYKCSAMEKVDFKSADKFALTYTDVQIQPFAVNKTFGNLNQCKADTPTVKPAEPPVGSWNISNGKGICMRMQFAGQFIISYKMGNGTNSKVGFYLPNDTMSAGSKCDNKSATLVLSFAPGPKAPASDWMMSMEFTMVSDGNYDMTNFSLEFDLDADHFPGINVTTPVTKMTVFNNTKLFETASGSYYKCTADQDIYANKSVVATFNSLKLQPFAQKVKGGGLGTESDCAADNTVSNIVPIAVGCALAGLVIIVLIAYLIGRSRTNRSGYQSV